MEFLNKLKKNTPTIHASKEINPHHHWVIILKAFFVLVFILIIGSFYLLYQIENEQFVPTPQISDQKETALKENLLTSIAATMQEKMNRTDDLLKHPISYKDPSK